MANKRMFSLSIVNTDAFIDMPASSQLLYFHLAMRADDEGFVGSPKLVMRILGSSQDDYKVLIAKKFIIQFESGVCVIKHWLIHNTVRMDRFGGTTYINEKEQLVIKDNKAYKLVNIEENELATTGIPNGNHLATQVKLNEVKLSKDKLNEDNIISEQSSQNITSLIKSFESINPACSKFYVNKTQRSACEFLIKTYSLERVKLVIEKTLPKSNIMQFFPNIITPCQLQDKWSALENAIKKYQSEKLSIKNKYPII